jgi:hypothetical protein
VFRAIDPVKPNANRRFVFQVFGVSPSSTPMTFARNVDVSDENAIALNRNRIKKAARNNIMAPVSYRDIEKRLLGLNIMVDIVVPTCVK